ncbi:MAG: class IV adenylate cyclase [Synergistaceae bacterium]|nr:class IV adenylate cyclase [Synergistaceae bacterium]
MARNVEIKARAGNVAELTARVARMATSGPEEIAQDDTFFRCPEGRLKLRAFSDGAGQLIFYKRPDTEGPKTSSYSIAPVENADAMRETLAAALGQSGRVRKRRTLFLVGRTRVHIDRVEDLGNFLELEVVLEEGEPEADGVREAEELLAALAIPQPALVDRAYVDLLEARGKGEPSRP